MKAIKRNIFYRPMTKGGEDVRLSGQVNTDGRTPVKELKTEPQAQHLGCFTGGMVAIAAKIFQNEEELTLGRQLVEGCLWAYEVMPLGIMPEIMHVVPCDDVNNCPWDEEKWHQAIKEVHQIQDNVQKVIGDNRLQPGVVKIDDTRYILRYVEMSQPSEMTNCVKGLRQSSPSLYFIGSLEIQHCAKGRGTCLTQLLNTL